MKGDHVLIKKYHSVLNKVIIFLSTLWYDQSMCENLYIRTVSQVDDVFNGPLVPFQLE